MSAKVVEKTIVISALSIFETLELNLSRLFLFSDGNFFSRVGNIARIDRVENFEL